MTEPVRVEVKTASPYPVVIGRGLLGDLVAEFDGARYLRHMPQPKLYRDGVPVAVTSADTAPIVVYLLADESAVCTGGDYMVDAGFTAGPNCPGLPGF